MAKKWKIEPPHIWTEMVNFDRTRYHITTNDKELIKYIEEHGYERYAILKKPRLSINTGKPTDIYDSYAVYLVSKEFGDQLLAEGRKITFRLIKEKRQRRSKKNDTNAGTGTAAKRHAVRSKSKVRSKNKANGQEQDPTSI